MPLNQIWGSYAPVFKVSIDLIESAPVGAGLRTRTEVRRLKMAECEHAHWAMAPLSQRKASVTSTNTSSNSSIAPAVSPVLPPRRFIITLRSQ